MSAAFVTMHLRVFSFAVFTEKRTLYKLRIKGSQPKLSIVCTGFSSLRILVFSPRPHTVFDLRDCVAGNIVHR